MSGPGTAFVEGVGLATAIGLEARAVAAAARAGICRYRESEHHEPGGGPYVLALVPDEALETCGALDRGGRILRLATMALREALAVLPPRARRPIPLIWSIPETVPEVPDPVGADFLPLLARAAGVELDPNWSSMESAGAAGGLASISKAMDLFALGRAEHVFIGAADSPCDPLFLETAGARGRFRSGRAMDALVPGEGAGVLLLASKPSPTALAAVDRPGVGVERGHRSSPEPHLGDGLADAVRTALQGSGEKIGSVLAALNGETFLAKEWGTATIRNQTRLASTAPVDHPAECFGDLGAAMGVVLAGMAAVEIAREKRAAPCLVWAASEGPARAAALLHRAPSAVLSRRRP